MREEGRERGREGEGERKIGRKKVEEQMSRSKVYRGCSRLRQCFTHIAGTPDLLIHLLHRQVEGNDLVAHEKFHSSVILQ